MQSETPYDAPTCQALWTTRYVHIYLSIFLFDFLTGFLKVLSLPIVQFSVSAILINSSETLIAIVGSQRIVVCDAPSRGFMSSTEHSLKVRYALFCLFLFLSHVSI